MRSSMHVAELAVSFRVLFSFSVYPASAVAKASPLEAGVGNLRRIKKPKIESLEFNGLDSCVTESDMQKSSATPVAELEKTRFLKTKM